MATTKGLHMTAIFDSFVLTNRIGRLYEPLRKERLAPSFKGETHDGAFLSSVGQSLSKSDGIPSLNEPVK